MFIEPLEPRSLLAHGTIDTAFATAGLLTGDPVNAPSASDSGQVALARQADGKLLIASKITRINVDAQIARYSKKGVPDRSFATAGKLRLNFGQVDTPADVAVQSDGSILVLLTTSSLDFGSQSTRLLRFSSTGRRDNTFAGTGTRNLASSDHYKHIDFDGQGRILLDDQAGKVLRLTPNGAIDRAFGRKGVRNVPVPQTPALPDGATPVTQSTDRQSPKYTSASPGFLGLSQLDLVATDADQQVVTDVHTLTARRYTANGKPDLHFGSGGVASIDMKAATGRAVASIALADSAALPNGTFLIAGHISSSPSTSAGPDFVTRLKANGTIDTAFGQNGFFWFDHRITDLVAAKSGSAFLARLPRTQSADDVLIGRLTSQGILTTAFGTGGTTTIDFGAHDAAESLIVEPKGAFLMLATRSTTDENFQYRSAPAVARVL